MEYTTTGTYYRWNTLPFTDNLLQWNHFKRWSMKRAQLCFWVVLVLFFVVKMKFRLCRKTSIRYILAKAAIVLRTSLRDLSIGEVPLTLENFVFCEKKQMKIRNCKKIEFVTPAPALAGLDFSKRKIKNVRNPDNFSAKMHENMAKRP